MKLSIEKNDIKEKLCISLCLVFIVFFPLIWSFFGLDTADTSSYLYWYQHPRSEYISLFTYLSVLIGAVWFRLFKGLGIWGLNFFNVLIMWVASIVTYLSLKERLGKLSSALGIALTVGIATTYIKIYNFHQFNMLIQLFVVFFVLKGFEKNSIYFIPVGFFIGIMPFSRITSILGFLYVPVIFIYSIRIFDFKTGIKNTFLTILGSIAGIVSVFSVYYYLGLGPKIYSEIQRLFVLGNSSNQSLYSFKDLIGNFVINVFYTLITAGLLYKFALYYGHFSNEGTRVKKKINAEKIISLVIAVLLIVFVYIFTYKIGMFPKGWAQLTGYSWMIHGILLLVGVGYFIKPIVLNNKKNISLSLIAVLGIASMWMTFVGSAVRLRHVILGTWILFPLLIYHISLIYNGSIKRTIFIDTEFIFERSNKKLAVLLFLPVFVITCIQTFTINMYDSPKIHELNYYLSDDVVGNVRTTQREGVAIQQVSNFINSNKKPQQKLMVYGNSVLLYTTTDMESYVYPWVVVSSYLKNQFEIDLNKNEQSGLALPIVVINRTNAYFGFNENDYEKLLKYETNANHNGKKSVLNNFLDRNKYSLKYISDYYLVYLPEVN